MNFPVFDLHCDTALGLMGAKLSEEKSFWKNDLHIDLQRASQFPAYCQCFGCFVTPEMKKWYGISPQEVFHREICAIRKGVEKNRDKISFVKKPIEIEENARTGKMSAVLTIEGPAGFDFNPEKLEELSQMGFRITTLGWNEKNILSGSNVTGGGLTDLGRKFVMEAQRTGMIVDVSHLSDEGFWDIIDITQAPIIASHSNSRKLCGVPRNLTDEMFLEICRTGGVAGINLFSEFIGENPTIDDVCNHILHFMELDPAGDHIALGGDLDGCDTLPKGIAGVEGYPQIAQRLLERGLDSDSIYKIFWSNALGVMKRCCM